jgi:hypothetical protein
MKILICLLLFGSLITLSSCSRLDLAFDYAPRYMANTLDDTFDFSSERYQKVKEGIKKDLDKNKVELLQEVIIKIDDVLLLVDKKDLALGDIRKLNDDVKLLQKKGIYAFKASFAELILPLSKKELEHLKEYTADKFKKADERLASKEDYAEFAQTSFKKTMKTFFDSVTKEQESLYEKFVEDNYDFFKYQVVWRKNFLSHFEDLFNKSEDKSALLDYVMKYYAGDDSVKTPEYNQKQQKFYENAIKLESDLWKTTSEKQKSEFKKTLTSIKEELSGMLNQIKK